MQFDVEVSPSVGVMNYHIYMKNVLVVEVGEDTSLLGCPKNATFFGSRI